MTRLEGKVALITGAATGVEGELMGFGDVDDLDDGVLIVIVIVARRRCVAQGPDHAAVLVEIALFDLVAIDFAGLHTPVLICPQVAIISVSQVDDWNPFEFCGLIAEHRTECPIDLKESAIAMEHKHTDRCAVERALKALFAANQQLCCFDPLRNFVSQLEVAVFEFSGALFDLRFELLFASFDLGQD